MYKKCLDILYTNTYAITESNIKMYKKCSRYKLKRLDFKPSNF